MNLTLCGDFAVFEANATSKLCIRYSKHHNHTPLHIYVLAHMQAMVVVLWHSLTWLSAMLPSVGPLGPSLSPTARERLTNLT
jgi:hypothetical protein